MSKQGAFIRLSNDDIEFAEDIAVCEMIQKGVIFLGGKEGPFFEVEEKDDGQVGLWINCNDLWFWACADAEPLLMCDVEGLYVAACNPRRFSFERWMSLRNNRRPMPEIVRDMKKAGVWDDAMESLPE